MCVPFKFYNKYEIILVYDINVTGTLGSPDGARNSRRLVSQSKSSAVECLYDNAKVKSKAGVVDRCVMELRVGIDKALFASC